MLNLLTKVSKIPHKIKTLAGITFDVRIAENEHPEKILQLKPLSKTFSHPVDSFLEKKQAVQSSSQSSCLSSLKEPLVEKPDLNRKVSCLVDKFD